MIQKLSEVVTQTIFVGRSRVTIHRVCVDESQRQGLGKALTEAEAENPQQAFSACLRPVENCKRYTLTLLAVSCKPENWRFSWDVLL